MVCVCVKWMVSGPRGRRGRPVTPTVVDIVSGFATVRRRRTTVATVTAATLPPTTAPSSSALVPSTLSPALLNHCIRIRIRLFVHKTSRKCT